MPRSIKQQSRLAAAWEVHAPRVAAARAEARGLAARLARENAACPFTLAVERGSFASDRAWQDRLLRFEYQRRSAAAAAAAAGDPTDGGRGVGVALAALSEMLVRGG